MLKKISSGIGVSLSVIGIFAIAGAIETNGSLLKPIVITFIGVILAVIGESDGTNNKHTSSDSNRLHFLP